MASVRLQRVCRILGWLAGIVIACAAAAAVALLMPFVQRALLLRLLASNGATGITVGHFHATPWGLAAERVSFGRGPLQADVRGLRVTLSRRALLHRRLELTRVTADALDAYWDLDAAAAVSARHGPARGTELPFGGFLETLKLPLPIAVDRVDLGGRVALSHGPNPLADMRWHLEGGGIAPGRTGSIGYEVEVTQAKGTAGAARTKGSLRVTEDSLGKLTGVALASGVGMEQGALAKWNVNVDISAVSTPDGENYTARATVGQDIRVELDGGFSRKNQEMDTHLAVSAQPTLDARFQTRRGILPAPSSLTARLDATLRRVGPTWEVTKAVAALRGGPTGAAIRLKLAHPWSLDNRAGTESIANLKIARIPVDWANPWLAAAGVRLDPCLLDAAWDIRVVGDTVVFVPSQPLTVAPIRVVGSRVPDIGVLSLRASPRLEISRTRARLLLESLTLSAENGFALGASMDASASWVGAPIATVDSLDITVRRNPTAAPFVEARLLQPLRVDPSKGMAGIGPATPGDLFQLGFQGMPLGWISRFTPGRAFAGTLAEGVSVLAWSPDKGWTLGTPKPWNLSGLRFAEGGRDYFKGTLHASPGMAYGPTERWVRLEGISAVDDRGYRLSGRLGMGLRAGDGRVGGGVSLQLLLPRLPGARAETGPVRLSISAVAHLLGGSRGELARLAVAATTASGAKLFSMAADHPIAVERTEASEWIVSSAEPVSLTTGAVQLSRLNPLLAPRGFVIGGTIPAAELQLHFSPRRVLLESKSPLAASRFHLERDGRVVIDRALLRFGTSLDLGIEHHLMPALTMKSLAVLRITDGVVAAEGSRVARFSGLVRASATEKSASLRDVSGAVWIDLGALGRMPLFARSRMPGQGELTLALHKSLERGQTVEFAGRLDHVVSRKGVAAPALTLAGRAHGDVNQRVGGFSVTATLLSPSQPSDLHFGLKVDMARLSVVDVSSKLEGSYVDVDALRRFASAFTPAAAPATPAVVAKVSPARIAVPRTPAPTGPLPAAAGAPWGGVRGRFILAIRKVAFPPYVIEHLGGRLDLTADSLTLTGLSGDVLDGKWTADFAARFRPGDPAGAESLDSHFRVTQLDAGKAARMRFNNPAAGADGRFDLDVAVTSHANRWEDLAANASGRFTLTGHEARVRLILPKQDMIADALVMGGTLTFSSELRALGRFVRRISDIPIDRLQASGTLTPDGRLSLDELNFNSPDLRLAASGTVTGAKSRDILGSPLSVEARLAASGDMAVILKGMHLLGPPGADGFAPMNRPFVIGGSVGQPDLRGLYDVLAQAVDSSHGSWGLLMRKAKAEVEKRAKHAP